VRDNTPAIWHVTYIHFVQGDIQRLGKTFLGAGIGFRLFIVMRLEDIMLLLGKPGFYVASDLVLCGSGNVGIPRLVGHVFVVLLVVLLLLLLDVLGRGVAEVGRIHGRWMRRGISGTVIHHDCVLCKAMSGPW